MQIVYRIILLLYLPGAVAASDPEVIERPPRYKVGDSWTYQRTDKLKLDRSRPQVLHLTETVTEMRADGMVIRRGPPGGPPESQPFLFTPELNPIEDENNRYNPFIPERRFPLRVGKSWREPYDFMNRRNDRTHSWGFGSVEGWETVTVPAGTFRCLKIVTKHWGTAMGTGASYGFDALRTECWSPEVRSYVRMEFYLRWVQNPVFHDLYELVAFKSAE